jgi:hypothetical protein
VRCVFWRKGVRRPSLSLGRKSKMPHLAIGFFFFVGINTKSLK